MNLLNRLLLILVCLALIAGCVGAGVLAWSLPNESIDKLRDAASWLDDRNTDGTKAIISAVAGVIGFAALLLLVLELKPRTQTEVKVTDLRVGDAVLSTAAIGQRIEEAVNQVPHVSDVRASIKAKKKGVLVSLDLHVDPEANLAAVTDEACQTAKDVLSQRIHVAVAEPPRVRLHYRELRLKQRTAARPAVLAQSRAAPALVAVGQTHPAIVEESADLAPVHSTVDDATETPAAIVVETREDVAPDAEGAEDEPIKSTEAAVAMHAEPAEKRKSGV